MTAHTPPDCPQCGLAHTHSDGTQYVCPDCAHEWPLADATEDNEMDAPKVTLDANGQVLQNGDSVLLMKDLKVKGSSITLKKGTKVKGIRLVEGDHDIDCKVDGIAMGLKSEFVKKA